MITYSAPGKIIISGEHAVVFGRPALVSAYNLRLKLSVFESDRSVKNKVMKFISDKVKDYLKESKKPFKDKKFGYKIESQIPIGRGMGSSAALSVTAAACFFEFYTGKKASLDVTNNLAYNIEKYFHTNSSGVDVAVSCYGGLIYYRKEFDFLRNISILNFKIPDRFVDNLFLIDTGKPQEKTAEMVVRVGIWYHNHSKTGKQVFHKMENITKEAVLSIKENKIDLFKKTILENEKCLEEIGVVSPKTKRIINDLKKFGSGKITGAGGEKSASGFIILYCDKPPEVTKYCNENNLKFYKFYSSAEGLKKI